MDGTEMRKCGRSRWKQVRDYTPKRKNQEEAIAALAFHITSQSCLLTWTCHPAHIMKTLCKCRIWRLINKRDLTYIRKKWKVLHVLWTHILKMKCNNSVEQIQAKTHFAGSCFFLLSVLDSYLHPPKDLHRDLAGLQETPTQLLEAYAHSRLGDWLSER